MGVYGGGMREREVERELYLRVRAAGGWALKLAPTEVGVPDRLVMLPGRPAVFVEVKAPGRRPRRVQLAIHERLRRLGQEVVVLDTVDSVIQWVAQGGGETPARTEGKSP